MKEFGKIYKSTQRTTIAQIFVMCVYEKPHERAVGLFKGVILYNTQQQLFPNEFDQEDSAGVVTNSWNDKFFTESSFDEMTEHIRLVNEGKIQ